MRARIILLLVISSLAACSLSPDFKRPKVAIPKQYLDHSQEIKSKQSWELQAWGDVFSDPILRRHISEALDQNLDLKVALERVAEAWALLGFTRADRFPRLDLQGSVARVGSSENAAFNQGTFNSFALGGLLSYQLDLWGRYADATKAQRAQLVASELDYQTAYITLISTVAESYFTLLDVDRRLEISKQTYKNRQAATETLRQRYKGGIIPLLDVNQAETQEFIALAEIARLQREQRQIENALSVLLGKAPQDISRTQNVLQFSTDKFALSAPLSLLQRRPDVMAAEERLKAAELQIGVARSQRLPNISIASFFGLESESGSDLFEGRSRSWNLGADLFGPIIDFGKARSRVEAERARARQAEQVYRQTVLLALREVEDALISVSTYQQEKAARDAQAEAARSATKLSRARYEEGLSPYLEVLDIERSLFQAELAASEAQASKERSIAKLFRALGGGRSQGANNLATKAN
jgi:multidrug efflux system outer membrane protein